MSSYRYRCNHGFNFDERLRSAGYPRLLDRAENQGRILLYLSIGCIVGAILFRGRLRHVFCGLLICTELQILLGLFFETIDPDYFFARVSGIAWSLIAWSCFFVVFAVFMCAAVGAIRALYMPAKLIVTAADNMINAMFVGDPILAGLRDAYHEVFETEKYCYFCKSTWGGSGSGEEAGHAETGAEGKLSDKKTAEKTQPPKNDAAENVLNAIVDESSDVDDDRASHVRENLISTVATPGAWQEDTDDTTNDMTLLWKDYNIPITPSSIGTCTPNTAKTDGTDSMLVMHADVDDK